MSHARLESHRRSFQALAADVRRRYAEADQRERERQDIPAGTKRRNRRHLRSVSQAQLDTLRQQYLAGLRPIMEAVWAPLFRLGTGLNDVIEWRDAMRQAASIDSQDEALAYFEQARLVGDESMMRAIAWHAIPDPYQGLPRWPVVARRWQETSEFVAGTVREFDQLLEELNDPTTRFEDAASFQLGAETPEPDPDALPTLQPVPDQPGAVVQAGGADAPAAP